MKIKSIFMNWKSPYITRNQLYEITGGIIHPKTIRNLDSMGKGIPGKFNVSPRKVAYPVEMVIAWLDERIKQFNPGEKENE
ncbi:MAG: hypothetical protein LBC04_02830 [Holosporaceae bacterium]|jgi:hypothetical protein|nr:hypothetical protein [Holosporaceae bacterium]